MGYLQMTRNVESIFGAVVTAPHQIPYTYTATGGETFISLPFYPVTGFITINSGVQVPVDNYVIDGNTINLGRALEAGDVVYCLFDKILSPEDYENGIRIYKFQAVGNETTFTPDFTTYGVQNLYVDGKYQVPDVDYTYSRTAGDVSFLTGSPSAGVWVVAEMSVKQPNISPDFDRTLQEVARSANVTESQVIMSNDTIHSLNGKKIVYDLAAQKYYGLPTIPSNSFIVSVSGGQLTYNPGNVTVNLIPALDSTQISYDNTTVKVGIDTLNTFQQSVVDKAGFDVVGKFLNLAELKGRVPTAAGQTVYVSSAASTSAGEAHVGGGTFVAVDKTTGTYPEDGGIVVYPTAGGNLVWVRASFMFYDLRFWGVKTGIPSAPADVTAQAVSNAAAITLATNYARQNRLNLQAPPGSILTSEMVPIYNNMGLHGNGKAESTVFYKTTNNPFAFKNGTVTVESIDALVGLVPDTFDRADITMASFCVHAQLTGCMFRRYGLTQANVGTIRPAVGLFLGKAASTVLRQLSIEGGYIGIQAYCAFSGVMEMVSCSQYRGYGYAGVSFNDYRGGVLYMSGTSMDMRLVQIRGYQFGFDIARLQYSTFSNCTVEDGGVVPGETTCYAFNFTDPYSIVLNTCATEFIFGGQIRVTSFPNPSFARSLVVNGYLPIDQQAAPASTPIYMVDGGGINQMNVTFVGGDLARDTTKTNNAAPVVSGVGCKVIVIGANGENWTTAGSGVFTRLA